MDIKAIHNQAVAVAKLAEQEYYEKYGEPLYCGFAWVRVYVDRVNSKLAKDLRAVGFEPTYVRKAIDLWNVTGNNTQSMDIKEQGARAYAEYLQAHGIRAIACSRAD